MGPDERVHCLNTWPDPCKNPTTHDNSCLTTPLLQCEASCKRAHLRPSPTRAQAPDVLEDLVEFFWQVRWELGPDHIHSQRVLGHPSVNVVYEPEGMYASGISTACFTRKLEASGDVFSAKMHPGHASRLFRTQVKSLTNQDVPLEQLLDPARVHAVHEALGVASDLGARVELMASFLLDLGAPVTPAHLKTQRIVEWIREHPMVLRVEDVCDMFSTTQRSLQRLFALHVGVPPKWVINRYRMHEATHRLESGEAACLTTLAHTLGYFDQAHFTRDFRAITREAPSSYRARSRQSSEPT